MGRIELLPDEIILMRDSAMKHDRGSKFDSSLDELLLTNQALIVLYKGFFGGNKKTQRYPLDQVKVINGAPQVFPGVDENGRSQLQIQFMHGIEAFTLGEADADANAGILESLFTSQASKERKNLHEWSTAVTQAVVAIAKIKEPETKPNTASKPEPSQTNTESTPTSQPASSPTQVVHATRKCIGCTAPLSGVQGQKVTCKYCDTEQAI